MRQAECADGRGKCRIQIKPKREREMEQWRKQ